MENLPFVIESPFWIDFWLSFNDIDLVTLWILAGGIGCLVGRKLGRKLAMRRIANKRAKTEEK